MSLDSAQIAMIAELAKSLCLLMATTISIKFRVGLVDKTIDRNSGGEDNATSIFKLITGLDRLSRATLRWPLTAASEREVYKVNGLYRFRSHALSFRLSILTR